MSSNWHRLEAEFIQFMQDCMNSPAAALRLTLLQQTLLQVLVTMPAMWVS
jgi:hypothetical protein